MSAPSFAKKIDIRTCWIIASLLFILLAFFFVYFKYGEKDAIFSIAISLFINICSSFIIIVVGFQRYDMLFRRLEKLKNIKEIANYWSVPNPYRQWTVLFGGRPPTESDPELRMGFATAYAYSQIEKTLYKIYGDSLKIRLENIRTVSNWKDVMSGNVVILGGVDSIKQFKTLLESFNISCKQIVNADSSRYIEITKHSKKRSRRERLYTKHEKSSNKVIEDHGIVIRFVDSKSGLALFSFSGGWGPGTVASVLASTNSIYFNQNGFDPTKQINYTVVSVHKVINGIVYSEHGNIVARNWLAKRYNDRTTIDMVKSAVLSPSE